LIVEHADRIARELHASEKRKSWLGRGWGPRKRERVSVFYDPSIAWQMVFLLYEEVWINIQILCLYSWPIWFLKQLFYKLRHLDTDELTRITIYSTSRFVEKKKHITSYSRVNYFMKGKTGGREVSILVGHEMTEIQRLFN